MNSKSLIIIVVLIIGLLIGLQQYVIWNTPDEKDILLEKITNLELKLDSLKNQKDSIRTVIDSTHVKIITNEKHYQERINTVIVQPISADSQFIAEYIGRYIESHKSYFSGTRETEY